MSAHPEHSLFNQAAREAVTQTLGTGTDTHELPAVLSLAFLHAWWRKASIAAEVTRDIYGEECELRALAFLSQHGFPARKPLPAREAQFPAEAIARYGSYAAIPEALKVKQRVALAAVETRVQRGELARLLAWRLAVRAHRVLVAQSSYRGYVAALEMAAVRKRRKRAA